MRLLTAFALLLLAIACSNPEEEAREKLALAEKKRGSDSLVTAARLADEAVKLDSIPLNVYKRGMLAIEAGMVLDKNHFVEDAHYWLRVGVHDLTVTEGHKLHEGKTYYYRGVARSMLMDKAGACNDLYYARSLGFPVKKAALEHAECEKLDSMAVEMEHAEREEEKALRESTE